MNPIIDPLEGFSAELYVATLMEVAHADGLQPIEEEMLTHQAAALGVDLTSLPNLPGDLSSLPWATRVLVYRDALTLALVDTEEVTPEERTYLANLAARLKLPKDVVTKVSVWVADQASLLDRFSALLQKR